MSRRGFSLLEVLVATTVGLLVLSMIVGFLLPSFSSFARGAVRSSLQRQAVLAVDRMAGDLKLTIATGVSVLAADQDPSHPAVLAVQRLQAIDPAGAQQWEAAVVAYVWIPGRKTLVRRVWTPPGPPDLPALAAALSQIGTPPRRVGPDDLRAIGQQPSPTDILLCGDVTTFEVLEGDPPTPILSTLPLQEPLTLHLRTAHPGLHAPDMEQFELERSVSFRAHPQP